MTGTKTAIAKAEQARSLGWGGRLPIQAAKVASALVMRRDEREYKIVCQSMPDGDEASSRAYFDSSEQRYVCEYNKNEIFYRANFALAHALGHVVLGHVSDATVVRTSREFSVTCDDAQDRAATAFAIELLLPKDLLRKLFPAAKKVQEMAEAFGVSTAAMIHRLKSIGLV
jgi:Zn-dependent peptidase ImmA (M78 family)